MNKEGEKAWNEFLTELCIDRSKIKTESLLKLRKMFLNAHGVNE